MTQPLMPKATAVWLIENTALSFQQIADFCGLHILEVQSIADDEVAIGMVGFNPVTNGQLTKEEISRCSTDPDAKLEMAKPSVIIPEPKKKGPRYTPVARRQDRPDAISWVLRNFPDLSDGQISRLIGTTKPTINGVRDRTHWNISNIKPRDPVSLGLCSREDLVAAIEQARRAAERAAKRAEKEKARKELAAAEAAPPADPAGAGDAASQADTGGAEVQQQGADSSAPAEPASADPVATQAEPAPAAPGPSATPETPPPTPAFGAPASAEPAAAAPAVPQPSPAPQQPYVAPEPPARPEPAAAPAPVPQPDAPETGSRDSAPTEEKATEETAGVPRPE